MAPNTERHATAEHRQMDMDMIVRPGMYLDGIPFEQLTRRANAA